MLDIEEKRKRDRENAKARYHRNPEESRIKKNEYRLLHKDRINRNRRHSRYGLPAGWIDETRIKQRGKCAICKSDEQELVVDHNHNTGEARGLLCPSCNYMLGMANDNVSIIESAIQYIKRFSD